LNQFLLSCVANADTAVTRNIFWERYGYSHVTANQIFLAINIIGAFSSAAFVVYQLGVEQFKSTRRSNG
jgi:hypothetical protein